LRIEPLRWGATLAGCSVTVHQHLDGTFTITRGPPPLGHTVRKEWLGRT
jgi:hypothetical protein